MCASQQTTRWRRSSAPFALPVIIRLSSTTTDQRRQRLLQTSRPVKTSGRVLSIGAPIANTQIYVLDGEMEPCTNSGWLAGVVHRGRWEWRVRYSGPAGADGREVCARPFAAERVVPDCTGVGIWGGGVGRRLLRFLGRNDDLAEDSWISGGVGEIEARLAELARKVRDAVVVAREDYRLETSSWWRTTRWEGQKRKLWMRRGCGSTWRCDYRSTCVPFSGVCATGRDAADGEREAGPARAYRRQSWMAYGVSEYAAPEEA